MFNSLSEIKRLLIVEVSHRGLNGSMSFQPVETPFIQRWYCFQRYNEVLGVQYNPVRVGMELTTLVVIDSVWMGSCQFNYHMTTTTISHVFIMTILLLCKYNFFFKIIIMLICSRRSKAVRTTRHPRCRNRITGTQKSSKNI